MTLCWHRPIVTPPTTFHVAEQGPSSWITICAGRWPITEPTETSDSPPDDQKCGGCRVELGLRELVSGSSDGACMFDPLTTHRAPPVASRDTGTFDSVAPNATSGVLNSVAGRWPTTGTFVLDTPDGREFTPSGLTRQAYPSVLPVALETTGTFAGRSSSATVERDHDRSLLTHASKACAAGTFSGSPDDSSLPQLSSVAEPDFSGRVL